MRVMIGCERSGIVRDAFRAMGCDAWSCDLEPCEGDGEHHIIGDVLQVADPARFDFLLIHPPCQYLSVSGIHWNTRRPERAESTQQAIEFAMECFKLCARFKHAALENPVSIISTRIRKPDQTIQPYEFGEDASKRTCLWLWHLPKLAPTEYFKPRLVCRACWNILAYDSAFGHGCVHCGAEPSELVPRWSNQTPSGQNRLGPSKARSMNRARTYPGIAKAMAAQWGNPMLFLPQPQPEIWQE